MDALNRHITTQSSNMPQFPCDYCYDRQGERAFRRYDDLIQHLKGHHKIETANKLLRSQTNEAAEGQGMGGVQQPLFECFFPGCNKWGPNGYLRQVDLDEHQDMMHPIELSGFDI